MRAALQIAYGTIDESLRLDDVAAPAPGAGEVLVRVAGSTLNRKDLFALAALSGPGIRIRPRPPLPHVNGTDIWGTVAAMGRAGKRTTGRESRTTPASHASCWTGAPTRRSGHPSGHASRRDTAADRLASTATSHRSAGASRTTRRSSRAGSRFA
jgi:NADPH:quinone reductase-like Zn-dependent oxidoreductase